MHIEDDATGDKVGNGLTPQRKGGGALLILMDRIICWNVRGLNLARKHNDVKAYINSHSVGLVSLLETKVKAKNLGMVSQRLFPGWCFTSNSSVHDRGRILLAWKANNFNVNIVRVSS